MSKKLICLVLFVAMVFTCAFALATGETTPSEPIGSKPPADTGDTPAVEQPDVPAEAPADTTPSRNTSSGSVEVKTTMTAAATEVMNAIAEIEATGADFNEYVGDDAAAAIADAGITNPTVTSVAPIDVINYTVGQGSIAQTFTFPEQYETGKPIVVLVRVVVNGVEKWLPCQAKALNGAVQVVFSEEVLEAMAASGEEPVLAVVTEAA